MGSGGGGVVGLSVWGLLRSICGSILESRTYLQPLLQIRSSHTADSAANPGGSYSEVKLDPMGVLFFSRRSFWKSSPHAGGLGGRDRVATSSVGCGRSQKVILHFLETLFF